MVFLVSDRAPSTLKKHLCGWRRWLDFCKGAAVSAGYPSCWEVVEFLGALAEGAHTDRGSGRVANATGVMHALRFMTFKLILRGPIVCSWLSAMLLAVGNCELEVAAMQQENEGRFFSASLAAHAMGRFAPL